MPAYNFKKQFVAPIQAGTKRTTIRPCRVHRPTRVGDTLYLYTGMRTKQCESIGVYRCIRVEPISIYPSRQQIFLGGFHLLDWMVISLSAGDGFADTGKFFDFFEKVYGKELPKMELITWTPIENHNESPLPEHTPIFTIT